MGTTWGAFAIYCRDNGELTHWDVKKDYELAPVIVRESLAFWREVQTGEMPDQARARRPPLPDVRIPALLPRERAHPDRAYQRDREGREPGAPGRRVQGAPGFACSGRGTCLRKRRKSSRRHWATARASEADGSTIYYRPQVAHARRFQGLAAEIRRFAPASPRTHEGSAGHAPGASAASIHPRTSSKSRVRRVHCAFSRENSLQQITGNRPLPGVLFGITHTTRGRRHRARAPRAQGRDRTAQGPRGSMSGFITISAGTSASGRSSQDGRIKLADR
jgi:hypothetical protein